MANKLLQDRFKGYHSDVWRMALDSVPASIILQLQEYQVDALVISICKTLNNLADEIRKEKK